MPSHFDRVDGATAIHLGGTCTSQLHRGFANTQSMRWSKGVGFWSFGKDRVIRAAKEAELKGDLAQATALYAQAGRPAEAARLFILRADSETDPKLRLQFYGQAAAIAETGSAIQIGARVKRAELRMAIAGSVGHSALGRKDIEDAARELEEVGHFSAAARAYKELGDRESFTRALAAAGEVEELEWALSEDADRDKKEISNLQGKRQVTDLWDTGRRREAIAHARSIGAPHDDIQRLEAQCIRGPGCSLEFRGKLSHLILAHEAIVGREDAAIEIASSAVSRRHLKLTRMDGSLLIEDLGSRNGTYFRGVRLSGTLEVKEPTEVHLGNQIPLRISRSPLWGEWEIAVGGKSLHLVGAQAAVAGTGWKLALADQGWVELHSSSEHPAYVGALLAATPFTLALSDKISASRGEPAILQVIATGSQAMNVGLSSLP